MADWRQGWYYRYHHDPGHHNTRAHYGVATATHKLIFFWKGGEWELYDLAKDPGELHNVADDPAYGIVRKQLEAELARLRKELGDESDRYATELPEDDVDRPETWRRVN